MFILKCVERLKTVVKRDYSLLQKKISCHVHEKQKMRHGRLPLCVLAVVSDSEISAVCARLSFQHHGHYPLPVSYLFSCSLV